MAAVYPSQDAAVADDSGRLYRLIADTIPLMVWTAHADGRVDFVNQRVLEYTGRDARQLEGWGWEAIVHPDDRERCRAAWLRALESGARSENEMRLRRADGEYRWHRGSGVALRDDEGRVVRWFGIAADIEERRQELRESEQRFKLFMENFPGTAWVRDAQSRYTYVNGLYARTWGVEPEALLGREAGEFFLSAVVQHFRETDRKVQREGSPIQFVDGLPSGRWLKVKFPVPDGTGGVGVGGIAVDITERSRLEEALRESERRFQLFMQHLPVLAWIRDSRLRYTFVNRFYEKAFGFRAEDMLGKGVADFYPPETAAHFTESDLQVQRDGAPIQYVDRDPYGRWLKLKFPLPDRDGGVGVAGIGLDITERSRLEDALRESEKRFRGFMDHAPALAWIKDARFRYSYVNRAFERYHDRPAEDVLGRDDFALFPAEVAHYFRTDDEEVVKGREAVQKLRQFPYASGGVAHWLVVKFPFADTAGETGLAGIAIDLTARIEAEEKARRYADDVRDLVSRLVQAQETERRRVADGLHDLIGQNLTALGIDLQALKQRLQAGGDLIAGPRLDAMAALLDTTIDAIRGVMTDLRPAALEEFGLVPALRWYASQFGKRTGLKVATKAPRREMRLPPDTELALFRIVQEALTNAAKHSGGTSVEIKLRYGERLKLTVQDDGRGFADPVGARGARRGGFGLTTMRERAEAQGGSLRVEFPERGTRVVVEIPVAAHDD
jgi:PAS domain S-box-containing protein